MVVREVELAPQKGENLMCQIIVIQINICCISSSCKGLADKGDTVDKNVSMVACKISVFEPQIWYEIRRSQRI